jgi:dipeptidase E
MRCVAAPSDSSESAPTQRHLLLASRGLGALPAFLGDGGAGLRVAWVLTAANAIDPTYALHNRGYLEQLGLLVVTLKLEGAARKEVESTLEQVDVVFVEGGNVFVLLHQARRSGFAELLPCALDRGCAYVGVSAGANLIGPDVWPASHAGRDQVPELESTRGLGLVDFIVVPHHDDPARKQVHADRLAEFGREHHLVFLDDDQAIEVDGGDWRLVYSP